MKYKWTDEDKFDYATQRLRANKIPNKKRQANRNACRNRNYY
jgi:hypothetical protein